MSVKALYLCLKLTEKLHRAKHTENDIGRAASRHWAGSRSIAGRRGRLIESRIVPRWHRRLCL